MGSITTTKRVWVITGVSSGLGLALATYVAAQGDKVVGTVRALARFPASLQDAGVTPVVADFSASDEEVRVAAEKALRVYDHVDVLVNNAGSGVFGTVEEISLASVRTQFQTNLFGPLAFAQPILAHLRARRAGHVLSLSSVVAPAWGAYSASKAAVEALSDALAQELKLFGVRVLALVPGCFASRFFENVPDPNGAGGDGEEGGDEAQEPSTTACTDPSQGFDSVRGVAAYHTAQKQIGDPAKYAARVHEVVSGTGLAAAAGVVARARPVVGQVARARPVVGQTWADGKPSYEWDGPWEMTRVPLGPDCRRQLEERVRVIGENVRAMRAVADSTDVEEGRVGYFASG